MTRREIPIDAMAILRVLAAHGVEYVVIGGLAVQAHGHPRTTQDLDLVPKPTAENRARLPPHPAPLLTTSYVSGRSWSSSTCRWWWRVATT